MDREDRHDHDHDDEGRSDRTAEAQNGEETAPEFGAGGAQDEEFARPPAQLLEEAGRAGDAVAAEPAEELFCPVAGDGETENEPNEWIDPPAAPDL